jgi:hypothetical protein
VVFKPKGRLSLPARQAGAPATVFEIPGRNLSVSCAADGRVYGLIEDF